MTNDKRTAHTDTTQADTTTGIRQCPHCREALGYVDSSQVYECDICGRPICVYCTNKCRRTKK